MDNPLKRAPYDWTLEILSLLSLAGLYYKGNDFTLQFDYSRNDETGEIREAFGGVYGRV